VGAGALAFLAGAFGYFLGVRSDDRPARDSADVGFLYDMTAHHLQAIEMSMIELTNGEDPIILSFARETLRGQSREMGLMQMRLGTWGHDPGDPPETAMAWMGMATTAADMPGMASPAELDALSSAEGAEADALFVALMQDHHAGGVAMARAAAERAEDDWVAETAAKMADVQAHEIVDLENARVQAGLAADPPGFVPDVMSG
jgi:uncharacterized protein (DUF305 family)